MTPLPPREMLDTRLAKALSHPVRVQVLGVLLDGEASPSEIARVLDLPIVNVSHHVQVLRKLEVIEQVAVRHVRGAVEHRYRVVRQAWITPEQIELLPGPAVHGTFAQIASVAMADLRDALADRRFNDRRPSTHVTYTPLELDEQGWQNVYDKLLETLETAIAEERAARERRAANGSGGPPVRGRLTMLLYEAAERPGEPDAAA